MAPVLLELCYTTIKDMEKGLRNMIRWTWLDEKISYTDVNKDPPNQSSWECPQLKWRDLVLYGVQYVMGR